MRLSAFLTATAATLALAHPGEKHNSAVLKREIKARDVQAVRARQALDSCYKSNAAVQLNQRNIARRAQTTCELRKNRGITANPQKWHRDLAALEEWEAIDHNKTSILNYAPDTPEEAIFGGNTSAILSPTVTDGPYYIWGEIMRQDYINVNTCRPIPGAIVDIWNANATGIYSGVEVTGNEAQDGWDSTYLRGIQESNEDGVVTFQTIFPVSRNNGTLQVETGSVAHIGQLFWNEVFRSAVEEVSPYDTNTQETTSNADDMWSIEQASDEYDPFPEYVYLGNGLQDGLFAIAGYYDADGGHENTGSNSFGGGGGGQGAPFGSAPPSGTIPSGTAAPSSS